MVGSSWVRADNTSTITLPRKITITFMTLKFLNDLMQNFKDPICFLLIFKSIFKLFATLNFMTPLIVILNS